MKWLTKLSLLCCCVLPMLLGAGCANMYAGKFEADVQVDPNTDKITNFHVITTKNYGNISAKVTMDKETGIPVFNISAENVDATSLAAIVARSNADMAKSITNLAGMAAGAVIGAPLQ